MNENLDALLSQIERLAPTLPPVPPVNGRFTDPRQIAKTLREMEREEWEYIGTRYVGGHGDVHLLGCGNVMRPLYKDARGTWYVARRSGYHYGEPDKTSTLVLIRFAQKHKL